MSMRGLVANVRDIVEAPLTQPLDMVHLFMIVGVILISWGFWLMVLSHINRVLAEAQGKMLTQHWLMLAVAVVVGLLLQKYFQPLSYVGLQSDPMEKGGAAVVAIIVALITLAGLAVIVGKNAQTATVISNAGTALSGVIAAAVAPVS